jgi:hypothetical protein
MTLPNEWFISMRKNRQFLFDLLDPTKTPKVPKDIRKRASECLKHFPMEHEIQDLEQMYNNSYKDKGILVGETNKELQHIAGEIAIANKRLNEVTQALQQVINKP